MIPADPHGSAIYDRIAGALLGALLGDALGASWEFATPDRIPATLDVIGGGPFGFPPGYPTDDGDQTLIVARAYAAVTPALLATAPLDITGRLVDWYDAGPVDVGATTAQALSARRRDQQPDTNHSRSNGALMRAAPIGCAIPPSLPETLVGHGRAVAAITHTNPDAQRLVAGYCQAISRLVETGTDCRVTTDSPRNLRRLVNQYRHGRIPIGSDAAAFGLASWALRSTLRGATPEQALTDVIRCGGDTDTTGCIAGALIGACWGRQHWPTRWTARLTTHDEALALAANLTNLRQHLLTS